MSADVDSLIMQVLSKQVTDMIDTISSPGASGGDTENNRAVLKDGAVAVFKNESSLGKEFLGAMLSDSVVKPYKCVEKGFT